MTKTKEEKIGDVFRTQVQRDAKEIFEILGRSQIIWGPRLAIEVYKQLISSLELLIEETEKLSKETTKDESPPTTAV